MGKVLVIDLSICNGCHNCQVACKDEHVANDWSPIAKPQPDTGQFWNQVINLERGTVPKVQVTFLIDQNGILNVTAREERSGKQAGVQILPSHGLTAEEVRRMEEESYTFAREDMTAHRLIDLRNQVTFDTHKAEQALAKVGDLLDPDERSRIEDAMRRLRGLANESEDAETIFQELDRFGKMTVHLAEVAITASLKQTRTG